MNCPKCGQAQAPGAAFCTNCGTQLQSTAQPAATASPAPSAPTPSAAPVAPPQSQPVQSVQSTPTQPVAPAYAVSASSGKGSGFAVASLVLGILTLPGIIFTALNLPGVILAIVFGALGWKSPRSGLAKAGVVLAIIGLIGSIAFFTVVALNRDTSTSSSLPSTQTESVAK